MLAAHSQIGSFPETMFFSSIVGHMRKRWFNLPPASRRHYLRYFATSLRIAMGLAQPGSARRIQHFLNQIDRGDLMRLFSGSGPWMRGQFAAATRILDTLASELCKPCWVEKSPDHLAYIDMIQRYLPNAKFIHIIRDGADVVASIYDAARVYPGTHWEWNYGTLDACIAQWNHALRLSRRYWDKRGHLAVSYERLVDETETVLREICAFLGVAYEEAMHQQLRTAAERVVLPMSVWKAGVFQAIAPTHRIKFDSHFDADQKRFILENLEPYTREELAMV
jgi:hypothetical protein